jgi:predicted nuclease of predicted toxin-antitoxin system
MRFLADESCDFMIVRALRAAGHDVDAVAEIAPRAEDSDVIDLAIKEGRILLTEDKDFGNLVFAQGRKSTGVFLLRFPVSARMAIAEDIVQLVADRGEKLLGCFVTIQPGRIRIGKIGGG